MPPPFSSFSTITTATSASSSSSPSSVLSIVSMDVLHFDVPLISTRRAPSGHELNQLDPSPDTSRRVPFLWERAPGIPKDNTVKNKSGEDDYTPKPPPGRWRPPNLSGNGDDASEEADVDAFSDALDKMSLSESFGVPCRLSVSKDTGPSVARAPSFIMKRFLPAANALAASSAANALPARYSNRKVRSGSTTDLKKAGTSQMRMTEVRKIQYDYGHETTMPGRACGIMLLFPWGTKRAVCGLKSPVRCQTPKMGSIGPIAGGDYGPGSDDGLSSKAWKSPGWGLPFLDTSRLRRPKGRKSSAGFGEGSPRRRRRDIIGGFNEVGRQLPRLKTPSEPWLANALSSVNRRRP